MRPIVFLSDYGLSDEFVGLCHGVIARIAPGAHVIDLTHGIPPEDVVRGAVVLAGSVGFVPDDSVFLAVVDPGVGTSRRAVAVETAAGAYMVGPDNGLLWLACVALGGALSAAEVHSPAPSRAPASPSALPSFSAPPFASPTFHGRDVFAPAAAHLAAGGPMSDLGPPVDPASLVALTVPEPAVGDRSLSAVVLGIDRFGNVQLAAKPDDLAWAGLDPAARVEIWIGDRRVEATRASTFGDVGAGDLALIVDSAGWLALVQNQGSAAQHLSVSLGDSVLITGPSEYQP